MPSGQRYLFSGGAVAFAAKIRHPDAVLVNSAAASYVPVIGGLSASTVEGIDDVQKHSYKQTLTFGSASSSSSGDYLDLGKAAELTLLDDFSNEYPTSTTVATQLTGFAFSVPASTQDGCQSRVFQAENLQLLLGSTSNRTEDPNSFHLLTAVYRGITLTTGNSDPVALSVHTATEIFGQCDTKRKVIERYAKDTDFRNRYGTCFHAPQSNWLQAIGIGKHEIPDADHGIAATFVTRLEWEGGVEPEGTQIHGNRLTISGLGRLYFGEIFIGENSRRPTLIRSELGATPGGCLPPIRGEFVCCDAYTNGGAGGGGDSSHTGS